MKKLNVENTLTKAKIEKILNNENLSKSAKIREYFDNGLTIKEIANILNIRYNFVYNVISNYAITENIQIEKNIQKTKKSQIIEMIENNLTNKEIAIEMKTNYNYVFNIRKEYNNSKNDEISINEDKAN